MKLNMLHGRSALLSSACGVLLGVGATSVAAEPLLVNVNFQADAAELPLDYMKDSGLVFGDRGNGYSYGWTADVSSGGRDRNHKDAPDQRYDTLLHMHHTMLGIDESWEIELPPATYHIRLVMGDPEYRDCICKVSAEGVTIIDEAVTPTNQFVEGELILDIVDGRLTLESLPGAVYNKLNFIEIRRDEGEGDIYPPTPAYNAAVTEDVNRLFVSWDDPLFDYHGTIVVYNTVPVTATPVQGQDYSGQAFMGVDQVAFIGTSGQAIVTELLNDQMYYFKIFTFDEHFNYAGGVDIQGMPTMLPPAERRAMSIKAMEEIGQGNPPDVVYSIFNDFAAMNYGAEKVPQMYERFGEVLDVDAVSQWHYVSERSAVAAWATNLPAVTYVEWEPTGTSPSGETGIAGRTSDSERYFHNHVHYMTGLVTNVPYRYRMVSTDERGNTLHSAWTAFTPELIPNVIRIPDDMGGAQPPYLLNQAGATYLLTQDISTPSGAFEIRHADVTLDLGGHTVTHATEVHTEFSNWDPSRNGVGVFRMNYPATTGTWRLLNGTIKQGDAYNVPGYNWGFNAVLANAQDGAEIAGITVDQYLPQSMGIYIRYGTGNWNIHHNVFKDRGTEILNRHGNGGGRPITFEFAPTDGNDFHLTYNRVSRTRQNGFHEAKHQHFNEVYVDSWSTNSFAMQPFAKLGYESGSITNNKIYLTGYHAIGISWGHDLLDASNNFIHMEGINTQDRRWWESFGDQNSLNGLRMTNYYPGGQVRNDHQYVNNLIVGTARNGSQMRGTELWTDASINGTLLADSEIIVNSADNDSAQVCAIVGHGTNVTNAVPAVYRDSVLKSNVCHIRFGDYYGRGYSHHFHDVEFVKTNNDFANYHTIIFDGSYSTDGHVIRDGVFGVGTAFDDVYWKQTSSYSSYDVEWTATIQGTAGANVVIYDVNNNIVHNGSIGSVPLLVPLKHATIRPTEWAEGMPARGVQNKTAHQKVMHTPHRVVVDGVEQVVTMDQKRVLTF